MIIRSTSFKDGERIPEKYTADGQNLSPELIIEDLPRGTESLIILCEDPDALKIVGFTWIHWARFNIMPENSHVIIKEGEQLGLGALNSDGNISYDGPCPPARSGIHNYYFYIIALDKVLNLEEGAKPEELKKEFQAHIIEAGEIRGVYSRD